MQINDVSALTGLTLRAIRLYEDQGLVAARRDRSNRREYEPRDVGRLQMVAVLRKAGVSVVDIKCILMLRDNEPAAPTAAALALDRLEAERARVRDMMDAIEAAAVYVRRSLPQPVTFAAE